MGSDPKVPDVWHNYLRVLAFKLELSKTVGESRKGFLNFPTQTVNPIQNSESNTVNKDFISGFKSFGKELDNLI